MKEDLRQLFSLIRNFRLYFAVLLLLACCDMLMGLAFPLLERQVVDEGFVPRDMRMVTLTVLTMLALLALQALLRLVMENRRTKVQAELTFKLYQNAYLHICRLQLSCLQQNSTELYNNLKADIEKIAVILDDRIFYAVAKSVGMLGGIGALFFINVRLAAAVVCFLPLKYLLVKYFSRRKKEVSRAVLENGAGFADWFENFTAGIREIKLFGLAEQQMTRFAGLQRSVVAGERQSYMLDAYNVASDQLLIELVVETIYFFGGLLLLDESITIGGIFAFSMYSMKVIGPMTMLLNIRYTLNGILPSLRRYLEFMALPEEADGTLMPPGQISAARGGEPLLSLQNVSFAYGGGEGVLRQVNLDIYPGEKVALCGKNGSGKSTLADLLLRLYEPDAGRILFCGRDIRNYGLASYRRLFAVVSQKNYLFDEDPLYNVALEPEPDEARLQQALAAVGLTREELRHCGRIGSDGASLSGGQRQKLALARALYRGSEIFIFDEVENNLDAKSRERFYSLLQTSLREKTIIFITHAGEYGGYVDKAVHLDGRGCLTVTCRRGDKDA